MKTKISAILQELMYINKVKITELARRIKLP